MAYSTVLGALSQQGWVAISEDSAQRSRTTLQPHSPVPYRPGGTSQSVRFPVGTAAGEGLTAAETGAEFL